MERQIVKKAREDLPLIFEKVVEKCRTEGVSRALKYYLSFKRFLEGECKSSVVDDDEDVCSALREEMDLTTLIHIIEHGNVRNGTSTPETVHAEEESKIVEEKVDDDQVVVASGEEPCAESDDVGGGFSFGSFKMEEGEEEGGKMGGDSISSTIDWDVSVESGKEEEPSLRIEWDIPEETPAADCVEGDQLSIQWMDLADADISSCLVVCRCPSALRLLRCIHSDVCFDWFACRFHLAKKLLRHS
jgi:hypothetical protein